MVQALIMGSPRCTTGLLRLSKTSPHLQNSFIERSSPGVLNAGGKRPHDYPLHSYSPLSPPVVKCGFISLRSYRPLPNPAHANCNLTEQNVVRKCWHSWNCPVYGITATAKWQRRRASPFCRLDNNPLAIFFTSRRPEQDGNLRSL
jgi:hypothetical protein